MAFIRALISVITVAVLMLIFSVRKQTNNGKHKNRYGNNNSITTQNTISEPNVDCEAYDKGYRRDTKDKETKTSQNTSNKIIRFVEAHDSFFMAFGTLTIAAFTTILAFSTLLLFCATRDLVDGAEKSAEKQLRAYVGIEKIEIAIPSRSVPDRYVPNSGRKIIDFITMALKNYGATSAFEVTVEIGVIMATDRIPAHFDYPVPLATKSNFGKPTIQPGQVIKGRIGVLDASPFVVGQSGKSGNTYIWGTIEYRDVFGHKWRNKFAYLWDIFSDVAAGEPYDQRFVPYDEHNGETEVK